MQIPKAILIVSVAVLGTVSLPAQQGSSNNIPAPAYTLTPEQQAQAEAILQQKLAAAPGAPSTPAAPGSKTAPMALDPKAPVPPPLYTLTPEQQEQAAAILEGKFRQPPGSPTGPVPAPAMTTPAKPAPAAPVMVVPSEEAKAKAAEAKAAMPAA